MRMPLTELLLRLAVAFSFAYPAISAVFDPESWLGYFPAFLPPSLLLLHAFGALEIVIALWILFGKRVWIPSALAALILLAIVAFNGAQFDILFRDVAIALAALSLAWLHHPKHYG